MFSKISVYDDKEVPVVTQQSSPSNSKVRDRLLQPPPSLLCV